MASVVHTARNTSNNPILQGFRTGLAFVPAVWLILFYLFAFRAFTTWTPLPVAQFPDPKTLNYTLHHAAIWIGMGVLLCSLVAYPLLSRLPYKQARAKRWEIFVFVSGILLCTAVLLLDPYELFSWFLD